MVLTSLLQVRGEDDDAVPELERNVFQAVSNWLSKETIGIFKTELGITTAVANRYTLLLWISTVVSAAYKLQGENLTQLPSWPLLVSAQSLLVDSLVDHSAGAKPAISKSTIAFTRRTIRNAWKLIPSYLSLLTKGKTQQASLLSVVIGVATRLKAVAAAAEGKAAVDSAKVCHLHYAHRKEKR